MTCGRDYIKERELKKIALVVISVIVILLCVACSPQTLSTPKGLVIEYNVLSWDKVENADSYVVWVNGEEFTSSANFIELSLQNNVDYEIKVKAVSNGKYGDSEYSEVLSYKKTPTENLTKLAVPSILEIDGLGVVHWSYIGASSGYRIICNNALLAVVEDKSTTTYTLDISETGTYSIQVQAIGDGKVYSDSPKSNVYKFVIGLDGKPLLPSLSEPTISYDAQSESLVWQKVRYAVGYLVFLNDNVVSRITTNDENVFTYKINPNLTTNVYTVTALGDDLAYGMSKKSNAISFPLVPSNPPQNIKVEVIEGESVLTWDKVDYCRGYSVEINGNSENVFTNSLKLTGYADGEYLIRILALGDDLFYTSTAFSEQIAINVVNGSIASPILQSPDYPRYISGVLYWEATPNAESYEIIVETPYDDSVSTLTFTTTETTLKMDSVFEETVMIFYVRAIANGYRTSPYSLGVGYIPSATKSYIDENGFVVTITGDQYYFVQSPSEISYDGERISWSNVEFASGYVVTIDGQTIKSEINSLVYEINGTVTVSVSALTEKDKYYPSPRSQETIIKSPQRLSAPNPTIQNNKLIWETIQGANGYVLYVNGEPTEVFTTVVDLKSLLTIDGKYSLSVAAIAENQNLYANSLKSVELTFTVDYGEYGTKEKPFLINLYQDFDLLVKNPTAYFKIEADVIDLENEIINPLFFDDVFMGHIDGNGAVIQNFRLQNKNNASGFFGFISSCEIYNLTLKNVTVYGNSAIISSNATDVAIDNVSVQGLAILDDTTSIAGGMFGSFTGSAKNLSIDIQITSSTENMITTCRVGGFAGIADGTFENVSIIGKIDIPNTQASRVGSFAGELSGTVNGIILNNITVNVGSGINGLIAGSASCSITSVEASGILRSKGGNSGLFGTFGGTYSGTSTIEIMVNSTEKVYVGGFAGSLKGSAVDSQIAARISVISPNVYVGGLAGLAQSDIIFENSITPNITVNSNVGYVGGVYGYYEYPIHNPVIGEITVNVDESQGINIILDSFRGNNNDRCINTAVTLKGNMLEHLYSAPNGDGTEINPYLITSVEDLYYINIATDSFFKLANDIEVGNINALATSVFSGVFDGNNYEISNIYVSDEISGLFAKTNGATISNLKLSNINVEGDIVGGLVGEAENTQIKNVTVSGTVIGKGSITGGLVGVAVDTTIINSGFNGRILNVSDNANALIGGLVAKASGDISSSFAIIELDGTGLGKHGGFAGESSATINKCYAVGKNLINHQGVAGFAYTSSGTITECYQSIDSKTPIYAFLGETGTLINCKYVAPTLVGVLNAELDGLTLVSNDEAKNQGVFENWDNSHGYSRIPNIDGQTLSSKYNNVKIELFDTLNADILKYFDLRNTTAFGVGSLVIGEPFTLKGTTLTFSDYGTYKVEIAFIDFVMQFDITFNETINPDFEGNGTLENPYLINNFEQLQKATEYNSNTYFMLNSNVEVTQALVSFSANLNGNGHTLTANTTLFERISGSITNIKLLLQNNAFLSQNAANLTFTDSEITINYNDLINNVENWGVIAFAENSTFDNISITGNIKAKATDFGALSTSIMGISTIRNITLDLTINGEFMSVAGVVASTNTQIDGVSGSIEYTSLVAQNLAGVVVNTTAPISGVELRVTVNAEATNFGGVVVNSTSSINNTRIIANIALTNSMYVGGVAGKGFSVDGSIEGEISVNTANGYSYVGGLSGSVSHLSGTANCALTVNIASSGAVGLAAGYATQASIMVEGSLTVSSSSEIKNTIYIGAIGSGNMDNSTINITLSYNAINAMDCYIGGAVGVGGVNNSHITTTVNSDAIKSSAYLGGAVGKTSDNITNNTIKGNVNTDNTVYTGKIAGTCNEGIEQGFIDNIIEITVINPDFSGNVGYIVAEPEEQ